MTRLKSSCISLNGYKKGCIKPVNEDHLYRNDRDGIYILSDGFSGDHPETARFAVDMLRSRLEERLNYWTKIHDHSSAIPLVQTFEESNDELYQKSQHLNKVGKMSCTMDALVISKDNGYGIHVGDARVYVLYTDGEFRQVTKDDTSAQVDLDNESLELDPMEVKFGYERTGPNRRFGRDGAAKYSTYALDMSDVKRILMCSDGLTEFTLDNTIERIVSKNNDPGKVITELTKKYVDVDDRALEYFIRYSDLPIDWSMDEVFMANAIEHNVTDEDGLAAAEKIRRLYDELNSTHRHGRRRNIMDRAVNDYQLRPLFIQIAKDHVKENRDDFSLIVIDNKDNWRRFWSLGR